MSISLAPRKRPSNNTPPTGTETMREVVGMAGRFTDQWALMVHRVAEGAEHPESRMSCQQRRAFNAQVAALRLAEKHRAWAESEPESATAKAIMRWCFRLSGIMYKKMEKAQAVVSKIHPEIAEDIKEAVKKVKDDASLLKAYDVPRRKQKQGDAREGVIRQFKALRTKLSAENHHELAETLRALMETYEQRSHQKPARGVTDGIPRGDGPCLPVALGNPPQN